MLLKPGLLEAVQIFSRLVCDIGPVAQNAVISGQGNDAFVSVIGKIRMFFYKGINPGNHIVIADQHVAISIGVLVLHLSVLVDEKLVCQTVTVLIVIIAHIILGKHEGFLSFRKQDRSPSHVAVLIHIAHIVETHHHIALVIHGLHDLGKFAHRCHDLIEAVCRGISGPFSKSPVGIHDHRVEKYMRHLVDRIFHEGIFRHGIIGDCLLHFCI